MDKLFLSHNFLRSYKFKEHKKYSYVYIYKQFIHSKIKKKWPFFPLLMDDNQFQVFPFQR